MSSNIFPESFGEERETAGKEGGKGRKERGKSKGVLKVRNISELGLMITWHHNCLCNINNGLFQVTSSAIE